LRYEIELKETRLAERGRGDDVALFEVRENGEKGEQVTVYLTPLFRVLQMKGERSPEARAEMVAGLGARAIVERLHSGEGPQEIERVKLGESYPGAPGEPEPLDEYELFVVDAQEENVEGQ